MSTENIEQAKKFAKELVERAEKLLKAPEAVKLSDRMKSEVDVDFEKWEMKLEAWVDDVNYFLMESTGKESVYCKKFEQPPVQIVLDRAEDGKNRLKKGIGILSALVEELESESS